VEARAWRTELLARLNDATLARVHGELDAAQSPDELARSQRGAQGLLETVGAGRSPNDARLIRQDLYCRLAETALRLGEPRAALEWARRGLDLDGPPTPFLAQLMALEGDAWAALGDDASAANSYMKALRTHETLLDESLDGR
jgi:predicted negative regulator of RcsB-dependent stress response